MKHLLENMSRNLSKTALGLAFLIGFSPLPLFAQEPAPIDLTREQTATTTAEESAIKETGDIPAPSGAIDGNLEKTLTTATEEGNPQVNNIQTAANPAIDLKVAQKQLSEAFARAQQIIKRFDHEFNEAKLENEEDYKDALNALKESLPEDKREAFEAALNAFQDGKQNAQDAFEAALKPLIEARNAAIKAAQETYQKTVKPEQDKIRDAEAAVRKAEKALIDAREAKNEAVIAEKLDALEQAKARLAAVKEAAQPVFDAAKAARELAVDTAQAAFRTARVPAYEAHKKTMQAVQKTWQEYLKSQTKQLHESLTLAMKTRNNANASDRKSLSEKRAPLENLVRGYRAEERAANLSHQEGIAKLREDLINGLINRAQHRAGLEALKKDLAGKVAGIAAKLTSQLTPKTLQKAAVVQYNTQAPN